MAVLGVAAAFLAVLSEQLVGAIDPFIEQFDLTPFFVGVILIPTIGNLSEHMVAVQLALKDPGVVARFAELGTKPATEQEATPEALKAKLESEIARWKPIIDAAGQYAD